MPAGQSMTLRSRFPRARYIELAMYGYEIGTFVAVGSESLGGWDIEPDPGSGNPFVVGADRTVENRNFTVHILAEDPPEDPAARPANTMYAGSGETETLLMYRIYVSDEGGTVPAGARRSPSAEGPGYTVESRLDGTQLAGGEVVERFSRPEIDLPRRLTPRCGTAWSTPRTTIRAWKQRPPAPAPILSGRTSTA